MLRLGGNGATSMFRAIAWFPKFETSGSLPWNFVNRRRFRPDSDSRASVTREPKSCDVTRAGNR